MICRVRFGLQTFPSRFVSPRSLSRKVFFRNTFFPDGLDACCNDQAIQRHLRRARQLRLFRRAVAVVLLVLFRVRTEMIVEFGVQYSLRKSLLQLVEKTVLGK